jgi:cell division septation protein DedD
MSFARDPDDERAERRAMMRGGIKLAVAALLMFGAFGAAVWYAYDRGFRSGGSTSPPLIRADTSPTKVRPDEPGGLQVPHQDKLVYETLNAEGEGEPVEQLLPPPEEPIARPASPAPPSEPVPAPTEVTAVPVSPPPPPPLPEPPSEAPSPPPAASPPQAAPQPASPAAPAKTASLGIFRIQLASYREAAAATQGWHRLSKAHPGLLGKLSPAVIRIDLGAGKGIYYRLLAGPLPDRAQADRLCAQLKAKKVGCLVVKP